MYSQMESRSNEVVSVERKINYQPSAVIEIIIPSRYEATLVSFCRKYWFMEMISFIFSNICLRNDRRFSKVIHEFPSGLLLYDNLLNILSQIRVR